MKLAILLFLIPFSTFSINSLNIKLGYWEIKLDDKRKIKLAEDNIAKMPNEQ